MNSPFHEGEQRVQERLGVRDDIEPWARQVVRPVLPEDHQAFYPQLPFAVLAARDTEDRPWATLLAGEPGFVSSPHPDTLRVASLPTPGDALADGFAPGDDVGLLGIELHTRRRNRVNGRVKERGDEGFAFSVEQSFGNCPQYITQRRWRRAAPRPDRAPARRSTRLSERQMGWIRDADTLFIASGFRGEGESPTFGMDASHRGGAPGFVRVVNEGLLLFPDYAGNNHFNTVGNLQMDPRAGLLFVDFESGDLLQLSGRVRIDWASPEVDAIAGAQRIVHFELDELVWHEAALPLRFDAPGKAVRQLRVVAKQAESSDVTSFQLAPRDGGELPPFVAGQHLPIELPASADGTRILRTYSLSSAPHAANYRISVKREAQGLASRFLHDQIEVGQIILAGEPQGSFQLAATIDRPLVLVSAGVGLTPLVSMLHDIVRSDPERPVWFVHGARDGAHHPLREEVAAIATDTPQVRVHVAYSRPRPADSAGDGYQSVGRVDVELLEKLIPGLDAEFYVCGPRPFMASVVGGLSAMGVPSARVFTESFGS